MYVYVKKLYNLQRKRFRELYFKTDNFKIKVHRNLLLSKLIFILVYVSKDISSS